MGESIPKKKYPGQYNIRYNCNKKCPFLVDVIQGVSENTDTFLSLPALVFITPQTSLGARFDP